MPGPADRSWQISDPQKLDFDDPVDELHVRIVNGTVNVVGGEAAVTRVEIGAVQGPPLLVTREGGRLTVAYEDLPWKGFLKWLDRKGWRRGVEVSVSVPAHARVNVGVVGASAVVSGVRGTTHVQGVSGSTTLVGLTGRVSTETVSGDVETQRMAGDLRFHSVSGDLTFIDGGGSAVRADSVSGAMILDLDPETSRGTDIRLSTVSGELAVRMPYDADTTVEAVSASGAVSSAFDEVRTGRSPGRHHATGTIGAGNGSLHAESVSGPVALLRRPKDAAPPAAEDDAPDGLPDSPVPTPSAPKDL